MDELRVNPPELGEGGTGLIGGASDIPEPPAPIMATGQDALSVILNARTQGIEAPLIAGMPVTKAEALATAQNVLKAAGIYERVDQQVADDVLKTLAGLEGAAGEPSGGAAGAGAAGAAATGAGAPASAGAGAAQQAGQLQQMMGLPMQMAQQAAQIPMQMMGIAAQIPQGIMQGVQSGMQQVSQMAGEMGQNTDSEAKDEEQSAQAEQAKDEKPEEKAHRAAPDGATAGQTNSERAPQQAPRPEIAPDTSQSGPVPEARAKPAPTRPATSDPEIVL